MYIKFKKKKIYGKKYNQWRGHWVAKGHEQNLGVIGMFYVSITVPV